MTKKHASIESSKQRGKASKAVAPLANISHLSISNVKAFDHFSPEIPAPPKDRAQWMILLGDNGAGKTTVLQCIALALLGPWLNALLNRSNVPAFLRLGQDITEGSVALTAGGERFEVKIKASKKALAERLVSDEEDAQKRLWPRRPAIFGYGVCRDSCSSATAEKVSSIPVNSVDTLFDAQMATMVDPSAFLRKLEGNASRAKVARLEAPKSKRGVDVTTPEEQLYKTIHDVLLAALGLSDLTIENDAVYVVHEEQGRVPLDSLSSGYHAFARWILDLLLRYADFMKNNGRTLEQNFHLHMRAIVLVDEIDLYLHPSWQHTAITELRALFPETTFVVTTHNPLCLLGALPGEIFVLRRNDKTNQVEAFQKDLPPGIRPDEVLTGEWFDLQPSDTMDAGTTAMLEEHRQLLRTSKQPQKNARLAKLEEELTRRLKIPFHSRSIRNLLWAASELSKQEQNALDPLDAVATMSEAELKTLIEKARELAEDGEA